MVARKISVMVGQADSQHIENSLCSGLVAKLHTIGALFWRIDGPRDLAIVIKPGC